MNTRWKHIAQIAAIWSLIASASSILGSWLIDPALVTFRIGLTAFLLSLVGHIFWLVAASVYAVKAGYKRWPLLFFLIHPTCSVVAFWVVNRQVAPKRPNLSFELDVDSTGKPPSSTLISRPLQRVAVGTTSEFHTLGHTVTPSRFKTPFFLAAVVSAGVQFLLVFLLTFTFMYKEFAPYKFPILTAYIALIVLTTIFAGLAIRRLGHSAWLGATAVVMSLIPIILFLVLPDKSSSAA